MEDICLQIYLLVNNGKNLYVYFPWESLKYPEWVDVDHGEEVGMVEPVLHCNIACATESNLRVAKMSLEVVPRFIGVG